MNEKKIFKIHGMDCPSCALLLELELEEIGVKAKCSYQKEILEVEYNGSLIKESRIRDLVKSEGCEII